ncbi:GntR family transcriptional regulator [Gracilibacillus alcaliphilus]|uniref:GntR family transcriptional regulator n=1 Tax=Gracilibacillus alcaliphilus TaxID=1401441 RepID=UPI00195C980A|nr:GntR family transcriptional regulator [Gracilibacillus alcaliphilus]MBM7677535.1 DNA-binding LacI/PurR family transcriptional regulator [Gracilibacillus alcaliphilus]
MDTPKYKQIYTNLLHRIQHGEFKQGDRVPSEKELSEEFDVSRITSRKALEMLSEQKVIERVRGKGSFVADTSFSRNNEDLELAQSEEKERAIKMIGLIIPNFSADFGMTFVKSIERLCSDLNISLIIKRTYGLIEEEAKSITSMGEIGADGLIIIPVHGQHYNQALLQLAVDEFPFVLVDRFLTGIPASSVGTDNFLASKTLTEYLMQLGHKEIGFISVPVDGTSTIEERLKGFQTAFFHQEIKLDPSYMMTEIRSSLPASKHQDQLNAIIQEDKERLESFVVNHPEMTAFVTSEFEQALLLKSVLEKRGKKIPEDYSIVCFDHPQESLEEKQFTHIQQKEELMAEKAMELLLLKINQDSEFHHLFLDFTLVEGYSSRPINKEKGIHSKK